MKSSNDGTVVMELPKLQRLTDPEILCPLIAYFLLFQIIASAVRRNCWKDYAWTFTAKQFKQYRLRNLTVCILHSVISGVWSLTFLLTRPDVMFYQTIHWYAYWAAQLPMLSMAYFACDSLDMLRHELSRWTVELLGHHLLTIFVFAVAVLSRKFLPYAYWALLMEVNRWDFNSFFQRNCPISSIFLHVRSIMQLSGWASRQPGLYRMVRAANWTTFVLFRFCVQTWQLVWVWFNRKYMHLFFSGIAIIGGLFFLLSNVILFARVLASDGLLGEYGRRHTAFDRDQLLESDKN